MPVRRIGLGVVLAATASTLALGLAQKAPCASGDWSGVKQYRLLCYSDIVPLYSTEPIRDGDLPYVDRCPAGQRCNEYPVITMYAMRAAAVPANDFAGFFYANALLLGLAAFVIAVSLYRVGRQRALYFALAPSLLIYAFVNWDLYAVMFATLGTVAFLQRRDGLSGVMLGLGAAAKLYPALLLVPFAAERLRTREPDGAVRMFWSAAGAWLVVNLPFMVAASHNWSEFFRFNANRVADWDSLWFIGCDRLGEGLCSHTGVVNLLSLAAFVGISAVILVVRVSRDPEAPRWNLAFPLLVAFLLTNKVYSPQYGLWLLPWFALAFPRLRWFLAFEAADVAVFVTRFAFFGSLEPGGGWTHALTIGFFQVVVLVRAAILVGCVVAFFRERAPVAPPPETVAVPA